MIENWKWVQKLRAKIWKLVAKNSWYFCVLSYTWDEKVILMKKNVPCLALWFLGMSWWWEWPHKISKSGHWRILRKLHFCILLPKRKTHFGNFWGIRNGTSGAQIKKVKKTDPPKCGHFKAIYNFWVCLGHSKVFFCYFIYFAYFCPVFRV